MSISLTILEVDDEWKGYFNPSNEIIFEVMGYETSFKSRSSLVCLVENYKVRGHVLLRPAGKEQKACSTP